MDEARRSDLSQLLSDASAGDAKAANELMASVYDELRGLAENYFRRERAGHTLQPTAVVHEAYMRLIDQDRANYRDRTHFFAVAAQTMRRVLIDHARQKARQRRGGGRRPVAIDLELSPAEFDEQGLIELDDALARLMQLDERQARVVEMRFFGAMTMEDIAAQLNVSKRTVEDDWMHARAWLQLQMGSGTNP